jgi:hypothetical protein
MIGVIIRVYNSKSSYSENLFKFKKQDNMDKIYLILRKNVMILLDDGLWSSEMIVLQKIGQKLKEVKHSKNTKYIKEDCYLTTSIEYSTIKKTLKVSNRK